MVWASIVATIVLFHPVSAAAAWLLVPYLAWVSFASALNFSIWRRNRATTVREGRSMKPRWINVNDRMQQGYRYALVAPARARLPSRFPARPDAGGDAGARGIRRQVHDRLPRRIPRKLVCRSSLVAGASRSIAQLVRRGCQSAAQCLAGKGLDTPRRSARLVPVVLPLLSRPPHARRGQATDRPLESHSPPCRSVAARLRARRSMVPPAPAPSLVALGV